LVLIGIIIYKKKKKIYEFKKCNFSTLVGFWFSRVVVLDINEEILASSLF
jgi:hypothetical protein